MQRSVLILGAGISGLAAARYLAERDVDVTILEARDRIGGRALSISLGNAALDLGPAWIWPAFQPRVREIINELEIELLPQYEEGDFLFETDAKIMRGNYPKRYTDARRLKFGMQGLAHALCEPISDDHLIFNAEIESISLQQKPMVTIKNGRVFEADAIICTTPGPLTAQWNITPSLPAPLHDALTRWPTWMAGQAKILAVYETPFWRKNGLSGAAVSQKGPLTEIADQSDEAASLFALFGFIGWSPQMRVESKERLKAEVIEQLTRLFGPEAATPTDYHFQDWARQHLTASEIDQERMRTHPPYGEPALAGDWYEGQMFFAGSESSAEHGGLVEGAIVEGERAARQILENI